MDAWLQMGNTDYYLGKYNVRRIDDQETKLNAWNSGGAELWALLDLELAETSERPATGIGPHCICLCESKERAMQIAEILLNAPVGSDLFS